MCGDSIQYQYSHVELETVINNIDEYIMPELQEACKKLWNKNIETFMVSNDDDNHLYIMIEDLSDKNMERMKKLIECYPEYFFSTNSDIIMEYKRKIQQEKIRKFS